MSLKEVAMFLSKLFNINQSTSGEGGVLGIKSGVASSATIYLDYFIVNDSSTLTSFLDDKGRTVNFNDAEINMDTTTWIGGTMVRVTGTRMRSVLITGTAVGYKSTDQNDKY